MCSTNQDCREPMKRPSNKSHIKQNWQNVSPRQNKRLWQNVVFYRERLGYHQSSTGLVYFWCDLIVTQLLYLLTLSNWASGRKLQGLSKGDTKDFEWGPVQQDGINFPIQYNMARSWFSEIASKPKKSFPILKFINSIARKILCCPFTLLQYH